jgi:hypothetical protein
MPTDGGSRDAIAVPLWVADQLNAAYSFLVQLAILSFFALLILGGLILWLGKNTHSHNSGVVSTGIWNAKGSPFEVFRLTSAYFFKVKDRRRWYLLVWMLLALGFLIASYAIPIKVAPYIIIDNAAPVSPNAIYIPSLRLSDSAISQVKINALEVPSALRAAGSVEVASSSTSAKVSVDPPVILQELGEGETILRVDYRYNITGVDFGLQHYPHLVLSVEGSCQTDYTWLIAESDDGSGVVRDEYLPFNDPNQLTQNASLYDSARPLGYFVVGSPSSTGPPGNWTWGAIVSSVQRQSFSAGTDPWYLTDPTDEGAGFVVRGGRPALSCWQNDVWSYRGRNSTILGLNSTALPGMNLSPAMQSIFNRFLSLPKIPILATRLGASSLVSADTALGEIFDAGSSSVYADLLRLILASYIASMNTLSDTLLFPTEHNGIPNDVRGSDGQIQPGADGFVVWSSQLRTLSIRALVIIPVITLAMFLILYCLTSLPFSWYRIQALQATVLYSCLHEKAAGHPDIDWKRAGDTPYIRTGDVEQAVFRPRFDKASRTLSWGQAE